MTPARLRLSYIVGFIGSVLLTLTAYQLVQMHLASHHQTPSDNTMMWFLAILAIGQLLVQLVLFLHLGQEPAPRWNLRVTLFAGLVVVILVFGSLWIMNHLDYNMSPMDMNNYIIQDEGVHH